MSALPGPAAYMVAAVAEFTQTDTGMSGTSALAMLAACAGGRAEVQVRPGWHEPLNLYTAIVAAPGEGKSTVQAMMSRPLLDAEAQLAAAVNQTRLEGETTRAVARRAAEKAEAAAGRADGEERDRLLSQAITAAATAEAITVPVVPRIEADDVTPEAAASLLAEQDGWLAIISAEGGIFDVIAGRYSGNIPQPGRLAQGPCRRPGSGRPEGPSPRVHQAARVDARADDPAQRYQTLYPPGMRWLRIWQ